jgi:hypothetical protein
VNKGDDDDECGTTGKGGDDDDNDEYGKEKEETLERVMATMTSLVRTREEKEVTMMTPEREETLEWTEGEMTTVTTMVRAREAKEVTSMTILEREWEREETLKRARRVMAMSCPRHCFGTNKSGSRCLLVGPAGPPPTGSIIEYFGGMHCGSCISAISCC